MRGFEGARRPRGAVFWFLGVVEEGPACIGQLRGGKLERIEGKEWEAALGPKGETEREWEGGWHAAGTHAVPAVTCGTVRNFRHR